MENTNLKETISEAIVKEEAVMSGVTTEVTGEATMVEVQENAVEVVAATAVGKVAEENEYVEEFNRNLPAITGQERNVIIANASEKYAINMQSLRNGGNMRNLGVVIYLSDIETGEAYIDDSSELMLRKEKIVNGDVKVMDVLDQFTVAISINTKKIAYERAQEYLKITSMATDSGTGMKIGEACRALTTYAIEMAKEEMNNEAVEEKDRLFYYSENEKRVGVRADHFKKVLDLLDTGYKQGSFGKKVLMEEARTGKEILIRNRNGSGYGFNMTGNVRYYMFNIESVLG